MQPSTPCFLARLVTFLTTAGVLWVPAVAAAAEPEAADRPPVYFDVLLVGAMAHEDPDNRVTHRQRRGYVSPALAMRLGGVIARHHLLGAFFQGDWRSTRTVLDRTGDDREWGAISSWWIGPEYRYLTRFGLYAGGSLGFTYTLVDDDVGGGGSPDCSRYACVARHLRATDDQGVPGVGARAVIGYELRLRRNLAMVFEAFGGVRHGEDEDDVAMTMPTYGVAIGVGF